MANPLNHGTAVVRLAAAPRVLSHNADGSKSVSISGYMDNNFASRDGSYGSESATFNAYVTPNTEGLGIFDSMEKGSVWAIDYRLTTAHFQRDGKEVYELQAQITDVGAVVWHAKNSTPSAPAANAAPAQMPQTQQVQPQASMASMPVDSGVAPF